MTIDRAPDLTTDVETTLGMMIALRGLAYVICDGTPVWGLPEGFRVLGQGYIGVVPVPVIIMLLTFALGWVSSIRPPLAVISTASVEMKKPHDCPESMSLG